MMMVIKTMKPRNTRRITKKSRKTTLRRTIIKLSSIIPFGNHKLKGVRMSRNEKDYYEDQKIDFLS